jgi:hypothetical protein
MLKSIKEENVIPVVSLLKMQLPSEVNCETPYNALSRGTCYEEGR